jgi:hypothetical protein
MTPLAKDQMPDLVPLELSTVSPTSLSSNSALHGVVTIKWPYSSSSQKLTFLLADPDPRKRATGGQVKISLLGLAAEALDQIESGEEVTVIPPTNGTATVDPEEGARIKWHITFPQGCILIVVPLLWHN